MSLEGDWVGQVERQAQDLNISTGRGRGRGRGFQKTDDSVAPGIKPLPPTYQFAPGWRPDVGSTTSLASSGAGSNGAPVLPGYGAPSATTGYGAPPDPPAYGAPAANTSPGAPSATPGPSGDPAATAENADSAKDVADASLLRKLIRSNLVPTKADLEVLQKDPNSPLFSVKSFEGLNLKPLLLKGIYAMGFNAPSKIQETALPMLLSEPPQNMIAQSQSGTGKTAAFVLTMLSRVDSNKPWPQCICLSPTYELALQTGEVTKQMAQFMTDVKVGFAVRGERVERGKPAPFHIVIGTPGTLLDWCQKWKAIDLSKITVFVLDEADVMVATHGHQDQSLRIKNKTTEQCQMLLFSATYEEDVMEFAIRMIRNPNVIRLRREEESLENVSQLYIECRNDDDKFEALSNIYGTITVGQSMIFCQTKKKASWLAEKMTREGHAVALLSGELQVEQRAAVINRFREGKERVLITTNVSARGIDVEQVTLVVNFDLPIDHAGQVDCETYLHRIGRTGRFGKSGLAINMVDGNRSKKNLKIIEEHFGRPIEKLNAEDIDEIEKLSD